MNLRLGKLRACPTFTLYDLFGQREKPPATYGYMLSGKGGRDVQGNGEKERLGGAFVHPDLRKTYQNEPVEERKNQSRHILAQDQVAYKKNTDWNQNSPINRAMNGGDELRQLAESLLRMEIKLDQFRAAWEAEKGGAERSAPKKTGFGRNWRER